MGIRDLQKLLQQKAPLSVHERQTKDYVKYKIAIDISVLLYQFLTSITTQDGQPLKNAQGEVTSHLVGLISRCQRFAEAGVTPIFVFDGNAFKAKESELQRRRELKQVNEEKAKEALRENDISAFKKFSSRAVHVDRKIYEQTKKLIDLMGFHSIQADGEAESLCVGLCNSGLCDAVASSDLDCVAYGAKLLIRNLGTDKPCIEIAYQKVLDELQMNRSEFIDLCILLGCDYVDRVNKVGPIKALELINKYKTIDNALANYLKDKVENPEEYMVKVNQARHIFQTQSVLTKEEKEKYGEILSKKLTLRREETIDFLVNEMQFERKSAETRIGKFQKLKAQPKQTTLGSFVKVVKKVND